MTDKIMDSGHRLQTGVFGGSFNPVHIGHIMLASYLAQFSELDEVWLMLSPSNPLKSVEGEVDDSQRLAMLRIACERHSRIAPTDVELEMPRPSFTINSLRRLAELHPERDFRLIIGSDNWLIFNRWHCYREIIDEFRPIVYPRPGYEVDIISEGVSLVSAPKIEISSTFIRRGLAAGKDMSAFLPAGVAEYIAAERLYESSEADNNIVF